MGQATIPDMTLGRFADQLRLKMGAQRVLLFGSRARGDASGDSDYDIIVVSAKFTGVHPLERHFGIRPLWYAVGGNAPMDLICLTPEEFERSSRAITLVQAVLPEALDLLPQSPGRSDQTAEAVAEPSTAAAR